MEEYTSKRNEEVLQRIREELPSQILKCIPNSKLFYNWHRNKEISKKEEQVQEQIKIHKYLIYSKDAVMIKVKMVLGEVQTEREECLPRASGLHSEVPVVSTWSFAVVQMNN